VWYDGGMVSDTAVLVTAAICSFILAGLGFVVTFKPLTKRWMQWAAVAVFVAVGAVGVLCVRQAAMSAERQQTKASEEQRALRKNVGDLGKKLDASQRQLAAVKKQLAAVTKQTAPLARSPFPVEISNPQALARQLQEPRWRQSGPLRWFPKQVHPARIDAQSAVELTIQADRELPNATIEVVCDAPIFGVPEIEPTAFPACQVNNIVTIGDILRFTVVSPTLSEGQAYKVTVEGTRRSPPINVIRVRKVQ